MQQKISRTCTLLFFLLLLINLSAQSLSNYHKPVVKEVYVPALKTNLQLEIRVPIEMEISSGIKYPVFFLFDKQNEINYNYNLQTIDYLNSFGNIPSPLLVGVSFPAAQRNKWTTPNQEKGKADSLLHFLLVQYKKELARQFPLADFTVLIGHSRTAMLSCYAITKFPAQVNAIIASSNSFFDFNSAYQQAAFEEFIAAKHNDSLRQHFYYFSSGTQINGDPHDSSVHKLNNYMQQQHFPSSFHWKYYAENTGHMTTPGLTTGRALNDLFNPTTMAINQCFDIVNKQSYNDSVPFHAYKTVYKEASIRNGFSLQPEIVFYNSIASAYLNDYNNIFKDNKNKLAAAVLKEGIVHYPGFAGFYSLLAEIAIENKKPAEAKALLIKAKQKLNSSSYYSTTVKKEELEYINELEKLLASKK